MPKNLSPTSQTSAIVLTSTGSTDEVTSSLPIGVYSDSAAFVSGASAQVSYVYKKLGGDVVDIELTPANVYAAYEEAVLEYSYIINMHQGKNVLSTVLGETTGTFDHTGELQTGPSGSNLKFPRFSLGYARRVGDGAAAVEELLAQVGALAVDDAEAPPVAPLRARHVGHQPRRLRATHHRDAQHVAQEGVHLDGARLLQEEQAEVAAKEGAGEALRREQVRLHRLARRPNARQRHDRSQHPQLAIRGENRRRGGQVARCEHGVVADAPSEQSEQRGQHHRRYPAGVVYPSRVRS